jgi:hypothetical protein
MTRRIYLELDFPTTYEVEQLDRIDRSGGLRAYGFPDALPISPQLEMADAPILRVTPHEGQPWVGVFQGAEYRFPAAASGRLLAWPDPASFCVVYAGGGVVVRADDPTRTYEIDCFPVTETFAVPDQGLVLFADFTNLIAYGRDGVRWRSRRLALDEVRVDGVEDDTLHVSGFFGGGHERFVVDLATGEASGQPFQPSE